MYKLILVDDDTVALRSLSEVFEWEKFGFTLLSTFTNGTAAMDFISQNLVDLVVTDIKMPALDGLEMAKNCFDRYPNTHFILISAYRDFSYAQKAISYNVIDYLTKPLSIPAMEEAMHKAHKKLSENKAPATSNSALAVQQNIFSHILCGDIKDKEHLKSELNTIGLDESVLDNNCAIVTIQFLGFQNFVKNIWKYGLTRLYNAISLAQETEENIFSSIMRFESDTVEFIMFSKTGNGNFEDNIQNYLKKFRSNVKTIFNLEFEISSISYYPSVTEAAEKRFLSSSIITKAKLYIEEHFGENISLKDIASLVSLSPIYFSAFFKQHTNENFSDYLKNVRLHKAIELLENTDIPVSSVCTMVGYKNITHFYNLIKAQTGMTPNEYRNFKSTKERN